MTTIDFVEWLDLVCDALESRVNILGGWNPRTMVYHTAVGILFSFEQEGDKVRVRFRDETRQSANMAIEVDRAKKPADAAADIAQGMRVFVNSLNKN